MHPAATATLDLSHLPATRGVTPALDWPSQGSAALVIPSVGVSVSTNDDVVPIASLTKMMTAYVTLQRLPLAADATGPCVTINDADLATYEHMNATGQSSVKVALGEVLCERDLLNGLLVHSANNYAMLLAVMVGGTLPNFVGLMNQTAGQLGLTHTHYVEPSGYKPGSVSTALEQGELAADLMASPRGARDRRPDQRRRSRSPGPSRRTRRTWATTASSASSRAGPPRPAAAWSWPCSSSAAPTTEVLYVGRAGPARRRPARPRRRRRRWRWRDSARDNEVDLVYGAGVRGRRRSAGATTRRRSC